MDLQKIEKWQLNAINSGFNRVYIAGDPKVKEGDTITIDKQAYTVTHVQPVTSGYAFNYKSKIDDQTIKSVKMINANGVILTFENTKDTKDATTAKKQADKATAKA